jgi:hypothetical protein
VAATGKGNGGAQPTAAPLPLPKGPEGLVLKELHRPGGLQFVCVDPQLSDAALAEGFTVLP